MCNKFCDKYTQLREIGILELTEEPNAFDEENDLLEIVEGTFENELFLKGINGFSFEARNDDPTIYIFFKTKEALDTFKSEFSCEHLTINETETLKKARFPDSYNEYLKDLHLKNKYKLAISQ